MRIPKIITGKGSGSALVKKSGLLLLVLCLLSALLLSAVTVNAVLHSAGTRVSTKSAVPTVIIDAGHGGFDGGAVVSSISEKDINLKIATCLADMLRCAGLQVVMTRTDDSSTESDPTATISARKKSDLRNRIALAEQYPAAIMVSIHLNKFPSGSVRGAQVFYAPKHDAAKRLAECIQKSVVSQLQPDNARVVKAGTKDTFLLYKAPIPTVITECGFMSNEQEFAKLQTDSYQRQMAFAVLCGILQYYKE